MKRQDHFGAIITIFVSVFFSGCHPSDEHLAPQYPDKPWQPEHVLEKRTTVSTRYEVPENLAAPYRHKQIPVNTKHSYNLAELIDLAQSINPDTRIAWEQSKQAAFAVGLTKANYLPQISAVALGGQQYTPLPAPRLFFPSGQFTANTSEVLPSLVIKWLLFDFGKRKSLVDSAKQISLATNIEFTGTHQKLIYEVSKTYFILAAERAQLRVAERALKNTKILQDAAEARHRRGVETITQVAIARRETAKAKFELEHAIAADNDAYHALLEAMGLTPTLRLNIAVSSNHILPHNLASNANRYIKQALAKRPDIAAAFARLRGSEADISSAKASYRPTIGVDGVAYQNIGSLQINNWSSTQVNRPATAFLFTLKLPLYDGGTRRNSLRIAQSKNAAAQAELSKIQDEAIRQVARAYDTVKSALAEYDSARALVNASNVAYDATFDSYRQGVETFTNAIMAETEKAKAESVLANVYASVLTAAAALAFSTGELTSFEALHSTQKFSA